MFCLGEALEFEDCYAADCPWSERSPCTASCGKGSRVRSRPCGEQVVDSNKPCSGSEMEFADCVSVECPGQSPKSSQTNTLNNILMLKPLQLFGKAGINGPNAQPLVARGVGLEDERAVSQPLTTRAVFWKFS